MPLAWWLGGSLTLACLGRGPSTDLGLVAGGPSADFGLVGGPSAAPGLAGGGGIGTGGPLYGGGGCMSGVILLKPRGSWACCPGTSPWPGAVAFSIHSMLSRSTVNGLGFLMMTHRAWDPVC